MPNNFRLNESAKSNIKTNREHVDKVINEHLKNYNEHNKRVYGKKIGKEGFEHLMVHDNDTTNMYYISRYGQAHKYKNTSHNDMGKLYNPGFIVRQYH